MFQQSQHGRYGQAQQQHNDQFGGEHYGQMHSNYNQSGAYGASRMHLNSDTGAMKSQVPAGYNHPLNSRPSPPPQQMINPAMRGQNTSQGAYGAGIQQAPQQQQQQQQINANFYGPAGVPGQKRTAAQPQYQPQPNHYSSQQLHLSGPGGGGYPGGGQQAGQTYPQPNQVSPTRLDSPPSSNLSSPPAHTQYSNAMNFPKVSQMSTSGSQYSQQVAPQQQQYPKRSQPQPSPGQSYNQSGSYPASDLMDGAYGSPSQYQSSGAYGANGPMSRAQQSAQSGNCSASYQHSPIPGNPTPPLTPASQFQPPFLSPNATLDASPALSQKMSPSHSMLAEQKPSGRGTVQKYPPAGLTHEEGPEPRFTFGVKDGTILFPFRLEHNLSVSNHQFNLKPAVYDTLMNRPDLDLQLKCFNHEDPLMNTNWPATVQVSVNSMPMQIDRSNASHRPLYLKKICLSGRNMIQITVSACCCVSAPPAHFRCPPTLTSSLSSPQSHLFILQIVHRPQIKIVVQGMLRNRILSADQAVAKIKRNFANNGSQTPGSFDESGIEATMIKIPLKCPITIKRITLPARGQECKHIQVSVLSTLTSSARTNACPHSASISRTTC